MSIDPVTGPAATPEANVSSQANDRPSHNSGNAKVGSSSGNPSKPLGAVSMSGFSSEESLEDEVQVQRDSSTGAIVIKYLDQAGNVVLQVPSSQVLSLARAIEKDLSEAEKLHRPDILRPLDEGGKSL